MRAKKSRQKTRLQIFTKKNFVFSKAPPMTRTLFEKVFSKTFHAFSKDLFLQFFSFSPGRPSSAFWNLYACSPLAYQQPSGPVTSCLGPREALEQIWKGPFFPCTVAAEGRGIAPVNSPRLIRHTHTHQCSDWMLARWPGGRAWFCSVALTSSSKEDNQTTV